MYAGVLSYAGNHSVYLSHTYSYLIIFCQNSPVFSTENFSSYLCIQTSIFVFFTTSKVFAPKALTASLILRQLLYIMIVKNITTEGENMRWKQLTALLLATIMLCLQSADYSAAQVLAAAEFSMEESSYDTRKLVTADDAKAYENIKSSFATLMEDHDVYALLYQCESYDIKKSPDYDSAVMANILTGHQVRLTGIAFGDGALWYQTEAMVDGTLFRGYIEEAYLISSDEGLNAWKEAQDDTIFAQTAPISRAGNTNLNNFPASYRPYIQSLLAAHPNWTFVPMNTNLDFNTVIRQEMAPARNLVPLDSMECWKMSNQVLSAPYWVQASEPIVRYYMDPRNFLNENSVFQFEMLAFNSACHTESGVKTILKNSFMENAVLENGLTYAQNFMQIGQTLNVSPYHLASRVRQEQGNEGSSPLISGTYPGYEGLYNYFNMQASGTTYEEIIHNGLEEARAAGWTTRYAALYGGSQKVSSIFIKRGQNTLYLQKFDVDNSDGTLYWHQYMQNLLAADNEGKSVKKGYENMGVLDNSFLFRVPVYQNMPASACKMPKDNLAAPTLRISVSNFEKLILKWKEIAGAQEYQIYRSSQPDKGFKKVASITSGGIVTWTDAVGINKTYYYKMRSYRNFNGIRIYSPYSSVTKATTRIPAPQIKSLTLSTYRKINVQWEKIKDATGYQIYRKTGKSGTYKLIKDLRGTNILRYVDDDVIPNNTYYYKIRAYKTLHGKTYRSSYGKEKSKNTKLAVPALVGVSLSEHNSMTLSWEPEKWVDGYLIYRADGSNGTYKAIQTVTGKNQHKYTDKNLTANKAYSYKLRTYVTVNGNRKYSAYSNIMVSKTSLRKPTIHSASAISPTKAKLSWKKTSGAQGYQVYRANSYQGKYTKIITIAKNNTVSYTDTNLLPNKTYFYKIRTYSTVNGSTKYSKFSSIACVTPRLEEPSIKSISGISTDKVKISWMKTDGAQGYQLYRASSKTGPYRQVGTTTGSSFTDSGLSKRKTYYYKIRAYVKVSGSYRYSAYSDTWSIQTKK